MSLELKVNPKLNLEVPKFVCDHNPLGEHLNKYEMLSHLNSFSFTALVGRPGSKLPNFSSHGERREESLSQSFWTHFVGDAE